MCPGSSGCPAAGCCRSRATGHSGCRAVSGCCRYRLAGVPSCGATKRTPVPPGSALAGSAFPVVSSSRSRRVACKAACRRSRSWRWVSREAVNCSISLESVSRCLARPMRFPSKRPTEPPERAWRVRQYLPLREMKMRSSLAFAQEGCTVPRLPRRCNVSQEVIAKGLVAWFYIEDGEAGDGAFRPLDRSMRFLLKFWRMKKFARPFAACANRLTAWLAASISPITK